MATPKPHAKWTEYVEKVRQELGWSLDQMCDLTGMEMGWVKKARRGGEVTGDFREKFQNAINECWKDKFKEKPELVWPDWVDDAPWAVPTTKVTPISTVRVEDQPLPLNSWPFIRVNEDFSIFRASGSDIPFPSRKEYLSGEVPTLAADGEVERRLKEHNWAFIMGVASVGKTTLAMRIATSVEQREHPVFYCDLAVKSRDDEDTNPSAVLNKLSRPGVLLILDNVHYQPELARRLWEQWRQNQRMSRMLLVANRTRLPVVTTPDQDFTFFQRHTTNPTIELRPTPSDLGRLAKYIHRRVGGASSPPMPDPPAQVLDAWHRDFGGALHAFVIAVRSRLSDFKTGKWDLLPSAAAAWVRERWLTRLDARNRENLICLAAFSSQELELRLRDEALPFPGATDQLLKLGLVELTKRGDLKQFQQFHLREPGWGRLILDALDQRIDEEKARFGVATRHPHTALLLDSRLQNRGLSSEREHLWTALANGKAELSAHLFHASLETIRCLLSASQTAGQTALASNLWNTVESHPTMFATVAFKTSVEHIARFFETAKRHKRNTDALWVAIESEPEKFGDCAATTSLEHVARFMEVGKSQHRNLSGLWKAIETRPARLAERAWQTSLEHVGRFMEIAKSHERDTKPLWDAILGNTNKLAERVWETELEHFARFVKIAYLQRCDTKPLWEILEKNPTLLSRKGRESSLNALVGFTHYAPDSLIETSLRDIKPGHWGSTTPSEGLTGASWLAWECGKANRPDLSEDLIQLVLRRANWVDFSSAGGGFVQLCWLIGNVPSSATQLVEPFLKSVCTEKWLQIAYAATRLGQLASGLRQLALHQSVKRCQQFHHRGLLGRLNKELARFNTAKPMDQALILQFLGSAALCGMTVGSGKLSPLKSDFISRLPLSVLPHRQHISRVEDAQFQLWLGLRAFTSITRQVVPLPGGVANQTLQRWQVNLAETEGKKNSAEYQVNKSMITWLQSCVRQGAGALHPSPESLWTLVGFPNHTTPNPRSSVHP